MKKQVKKLTLKKENVARLNDIELKSVKGGSFVSSCIPSGQITDVDDFDLSRDHCL